MSSYHNKRKPLEPSILVHTKEELQMKAEDKAKAEAKRKKQMSGKVKR